MTRPPPRSSPESSSALAEGTLERVCGRFANARDGASLAKELEADLAPGAEAFAGSYNIAPDERAPILVAGATGRRLGLARFGFVTRAGRSVINARAETLTERPLFRRASETRRCLVPATGFYEWERRAARRIPYHFHAGSELLLLAGLYELAPRESPAEVRFVLVTVPARPPVLPLHDRMPLLVPPRLAERWIDRGTTAEAPLLAAMTSAMGPPLAADRVSSAVNRPTHDGPELVRALDALEGEPAQLELAARERAR